MDQDKEKLLQVVKELEETTDIKLIDDKGNLTDQALMILIITGLYYGLKCFELVYKLTIKEKGVNKSVKID